MNIRNTPYATQDKKFGLGHASIPLDKVAVVIYVTHHLAEWKRYPNLSFPDILHVFWCKVNNQFEYFLFFLQILFQSHFKMHGWKTIVIATAQVLSRGACDEGSPAGIRDPSSQAPRDDTCRFTVSSVMGIGVVLFLWLFVLPILAKPLQNNLETNFYTEHATGWHWYQDPIFEPDNKEKNEKLLPDSDPILRMQAVKKAVARALDQAILNPSAENVKNYIELQNKVSDSANRFSRMWQLVLLQNPQLDFSIQHPTNQVGREVYLDQLSAKEDKAIRALSAHQGLFFFYKSTCPYCVRFAPIVKNFSKRYGISVLPITTDGVTLAEFPQSVIDHGQAKHFNISQEPALFTVNPHTNKVIPVAYGLISESDLKRRILDIATNFTGND